MLRVETLDPAIVEQNIADARSDHLRAYDLMSEATPSLHLWRAALATSLTPGSHRVEVRAKLNDEWFNESLEYGLVTAEP